MAEDTDPPPLFMCSSCYTPTPMADAHVVPGWNSSQSRILTTYRCGNCWIKTLDETRDALKSGNPEVITSFCEFLERQRFNDVNVIRNAPAKQAESMLLIVLDAVQNGNVEFAP